MEGVSASVYKGLRGIWRRRGYEKLGGSAGRRPRTDEMGRRRRVWRIKTTRPKRKLKLGFLRRPKRFFVWLRDAYVNHMLGFANSRAVTPAAAGYGGSVCQDFGRRPLKEYDEKVIIQIYKSLILQQAQLVHQDPPTQAQKILLTAGKSE